MSRIHLSEVFKFVQAFGQKGHQIGRKVGDALELIALGMIYRSPELAKHMVIEKGIEGATGARHKVEFAFFDQKRQRELPDLSPFAIVECKKVGVEQTIKNTFKKWTRTIPFHTSNGFSYNQQVLEGHTRNVKILPSLGDTNLTVTVSHTDTSIPAFDESFMLPKGAKILFAIDVDGGFHTVRHTETLSNITKRLQNCIILTVEAVNNEKRIESILVEDCLPGPQTPEKAKQASFVSLDVRKKATGIFDRNPSDDRFASILIIGEASHWEEKSRSMIRLCNDRNLFVPDEVIVLLLQTMLDRFGDKYQDLISKSFYGSNSAVRDVVSNVLKEFDNKVLLDMDTLKPAEFAFENREGELRLRMPDL